MHNEQSVSENKIVDLTQLVGPIDEESLNAELETCNHFFEHSDMQNGRHEVFNFAMKILQAHILSKKLDKVFEKPKCAAKLNVAFGFVLKNIEDRTRPYYYANENSTLMERSNFLAIKEALVKIKNVLSYTYVIEG